MLRLFFALRPTPEQNAMLVDFAAPLVPRLGAQPVPAENLHATLCFIGAVAEDRCDALQAAAATIRGAAAMLCFDKLEFWPTPRVLCATAADDTGSANACALSTQLAAVAGAAGFTPDLKPFRAHLTLARKVQAAHAAECEWPLALAAPLQVYCDRFALMRSEKGEAGSIYSVVAEWPLYENGPR